MGKTLNVSEALYRRGANDLALVLCHSDEVVDGIANLVEPLHSPRLHQDLVPDAIWQAGLYRLASVLQFIRPLGPERE